MRPCRGQEGRARATLGQWLGRELLDLSSDPALVEAARQKVQAELAARGEPGEVELQVDDSTPGQKRVKVKVRKGPGNVAGEPPASR